MKNNKNEEIKIILDHSKEASSPFLIYEDSEGTWWLQSKDKDSKK